MMLGLPDKFRVSNQAIKGQDDLVVDIVAEV